MLRTTNYKMKQTNETLPFAFAMLDKLSTDKNTVIAVFGVYSSKDEAKRYRAIETKMIRFTWDRKDNLAERAYNIAKGEGGIFHGWTDDIVTG